MALNSTILKLDLAIADIDRHYYADHVLTVAQHPSETAERVMMRVLAFALYADERLVFGRGLSADDEPDLVCKDLTGAIELWVLVGLPDERVVRRASGRSSQVALVAYGGSKCDIWWRRQREELARIPNLSVYLVSTRDSVALAGLIERNMKLAVSIQDGEYLFSSGEHAVRVVPERVDPALAGSAR